MKRNGKNLHNTLESMTDLNHLCTAGLRKRWLLIQKQCQLVLGSKELSLNRDRNKTETIWKWVNDWVTLKKDDFVHIFNAFPFGYHMNHSWMERLLCFPLSHYLCLFPVWFCFLLSWETKSFICIVCLFFVVVV